MGDASAQKSHVLTMETVNPRAVEMEYAVRGPIVTRAVKLGKELAAGATKPFTKVVKFLFHELFIESTGSESIFRNG